MENKYGPYIKVRNSCYWCPGEKEERIHRSTFKKDILTENFPKLAKDIMLRIHETVHTSSRINTGESKNILSYHSNASEYQLEGGIL